MVANLNQAKQILYLLNFKLLSHPLKADYSESDYLCEFNVFSASIIIIRRFKHVMSFTV